MVLIRWEAYDSIPNIDEDNNDFLYEVDGVVHHIIIPTGAYELSHINDTI